MYVRSSTVGYVEGVHVPAYSFHSCRRDIRKDSSVGEGKTPDSFRTDGKKKRCEAWPSEPYTAHRGVNKRLHHRLFINNNNNKDTDFCKRALLFFLLEPQTNSLCVSFLSFTFQRQQQTKIRYINHAVSFCHPKFPSSYQQCRQHSKYVGHGQGVGRQEYARYLSRVYW